MQFSHLMDLLPDDHNNSWNDKWTLPFCILPLWHDVACHVYALGMMGGGGGGLRRRSSKSAIAIHRSGRCNRSCLWFDRNKQTSKTKKVTVCGELISFTFPLIVHIISDRIDDVLINELQVVPLSLADIKYGHFDRSLPSRLSQCLHGNRSWQLKWNVIISLSGVKSTDYDHLLLWLVEYWQWKRFISIPPLHSYSVAISTAIPDSNIVSIRLWFLCCGKITDCRWISIAIDAPLLPYSSVSWLLGCLAIVIHRNCLPTAFMAVYLVLFCGA